MTNNAELPPKPRHKSPEQIEAEMERLRKHYLEREFKTDEDSRKGLLAWRAAVKKLLSENALNRPEDSSLKKAFDALAEQFESKKIGGRELYENLTKLLNRPLSEEEKRDRKKNKLK